MKCTKCGTKTEVQGVADSKYGTRRRRVCLNPSCNLRFSTEELPVERLEWHSESEECIRKLADLMNRL